MKIVIRPWTMEDVPVLAVLANNFNIWKNVRDRLPYPYTEQNASDWIGFTLSQQPVSSFAIEANGVVAGTVGFILNEDVHRRNIEIGYFIGEPFWGKGIATEAVKQMVDMLQRNFDVVRIYAGVFENNPGSMRVLEKNGFHLEAVHKKCVFKNNELMDEHFWVKIIES